MTDVASQTINERPKRRIHLLDTVTARGLIWLALAFTLIGPIAVTRLLTPVAIPHASIPAPRAVAPALPPPTTTPMSPSAPELSPPPPIAASTAPSAATPRASTASVRDRLAAILSAYQNREDFGTPESAVQASGALQWCARQLAGRENISLVDARSALSVALMNPRGTEAARVVSAIEAPAQDADDTSRMHCASLLYTQLNAQ